MIRPLCSKSPGILSWGIVFVCGPLALAGDCPIQLRDATVPSGIEFRHTHGGHGQKYLAEFMVARAGPVRLRRRRLDRCLSAERCSLAGNALPRAARDALYRNNGDGTFTDVTDRAGLGDEGHSLGVVAGDYDNDGDQDLYVSNLGPNVFYRNNGDGTFSDVTAALGVSRGDKFGAGVCFLDVEGDGDLDLYAANYVGFTYETHARRIVGAYPYPPGPGDYPAVADSLFRNNGDGTFTDASRDSGIGAVAGPSMGMVCGDFDEDGDSDIFVCNDGAANFHFVNDGRGKFSEVAVLSGLAFDLHGQPNGSMGADCGDIDNDGHLDLFMTDYTGELPVLYRNIGDGTFEDATRTTGAGRSAILHTKWGTGIVDFDNDGDRDLFIACGHFLENIRDIDDRTAYCVPNILLMNTGAGKFVDVSAECGDGLAVVESSRGAAFDDLDNDGDIDGVVLNANSRPTILRNDCRDRRALAAGSSAGGPEQPGRRRGTGPGLRG